MSQFLDQQIFNVLFAFIGAIGGWCLNAIWGAIKELQQENKELVDKVSKVEILIAGNYATKTDLATALGQMLNKLDSLLCMFEQKMDKKEDKKSKD